MGIDLRMRTNRDIEIEIQEFLKDAFKDRINNLQPDTPLLSSGLLDSLGILDLVEFVENKFHITFNGHEMVPQHFETITSLATLIQNKL